MTKVKCCLLRVNEYRAMSFCMARLLPSLTTVSIKSEKAALTNKVLSFLCLDSRIISSISRGNACLCLDEVVNDHSFGLYKQVVLHLCNSLVARHIVRPPILCTLVHQSLDDSAVGLHTEVVYTIKSLWVLVWFDC